MLYSGCRATNYFTRAANYLSKSKSLCITCSRCFYKKILGNLKIKLPDTKLYQHKGLALSLSLLSNNFLLYKNINMIFTK